MEQNSIDNLPWDSDSEQDKGAIAMEASSPTAETVIPDELAEIKDFQEKMNKNQA